MCRILAWLNEGTHCVRVKKKESFWDRELAAMGLSLFACTVLSGAEERGGGGGGGFRLKPHIEVRFK